jgi:hypothetical protein
MFGQVYDNLVLYKKQPTPGHRFRQIAVVELQDQQFVVHVFEGDVIQSDPKFDAITQDAEAYFHSDLQSAGADAQKEFDKSVESGWAPYPGA